MSNDIEKILKIVGGNIEYGISANSNEGVIYFIRDFIKRNFGGKDFTFLDIGFSNGLIILYLMNRIGNRKLSFMSFKIIGIENEERYYDNLKSIFRGHTNYVFIDKDLDYGMLENKAGFILGDFFDNRSPITQHYCEVDVFYCFQFCKFEEIEKRFLEIAKKGAYFILLKNNYKEHDFEIQFIDQNKLQLLEVKQINTFQVYVFQKR